jgi:hypothetical protein
MASFSFSSSDSGATFQCSLDDEPDFSDCTSPKSYTGLSDGTHTFRVQAVNATTPASRTWKVDTTAPTVSSFKPSPDGATGVSRSTTVTATFSEAMNPKTLTTSTFTLVKAGTTTPVAATVSMSSDGKTATLKPSSRLASRTKYTATVKGGADGATDQASNPLAANKVWSFTTSR